MKTILSKITLAFLLILIFVNISLAQDNIENNSKINNTTNLIYIQNVYLCYPYNLTNNSGLGECLTFTIYGIDNIDEKLNNNDYIYDEELKIYWINQGISLHLIFHNESYDLGITNISYDEYINIRNKIVDYFNTNGTILNETYYYANDKLVAKKENSGNKQYYHGDHLGSTTLVTNQSGGIVEEEFYYPHGDVYSGTESNRYLFTGQEFDKLVDLYDYGHRFYQASIIRLFISPDSIISDVYNPQSLNRYSYVLNNPYKYVDPNGNTPWDVVDVLFVAYGTYNFIENPSLQTFSELGADILFAITPVLPNVKRFAEGGNLVLHSLNKAENIGGSLKSFTTHNFRENVGRSTGNFLSKNEEAHHLLPQKFEKQFSEAGFNINDPSFGVPVDKIAHSKFSYEYNKKWTEFFKETQNPTQEQIYNKLNELNKEYGKYYKQTSKGSVSGSNKDPISKSGCGTIMSCK